MLLVRKSNDLSQTGKRQKKRKYRPRADESKEEPVVASTNTIVEPDTMVVKCLDTVVTDSAVVAPWWSPDVAGLAVLDWDVHRCCIGSGKSYHHPIISRGADCQRII